MILQKLEVEGFRCFDAMVTLALDPHRINILHGNNGTGKSSLFSALVRGLLDSHKVGGKGIAELCPWGTQLSPRITVVFEHNGKEYRVCKTFLRQKGTRLEIKEGKVFRPIANNEQADEKLRELLLAGVVGTGLAKPEGWGLAQALWCAHDQLAIPRLRGPVLNSVREILGAQAMSRDSLNLISAVKAKYLEYFTESGKVKGGAKAPLWALKEQDVIRLEQALGEETEKLEQLQSGQKRAQELQQQRDVKANFLDEAKTETEHWGTEVSEYALRERECTQRKAQWDAKCHEAEAVTDRVNRVSESISQLEDATKRIALLHESLKPVRAQESIAKAREREVEEQFKQAQVPDPEIDKCSFEIKEAEAYLADFGLIAQVWSTIERANQLHAVIDDADSHIGDLNAPTSSVLSEFTELAADHSSVEMLLKSALLHLDLTPMRDQQVSVKAGEPEGDHTIASGGTIHVTGSPAIELELSGIGFLRITGPSNSAAELRQQLNKLSDKIKLLCAPFQTADLNLLQARRQSTDVQENAKRDAQAELRALMRSENLKDLESRRRSAMTRKAAAEKRHPTWVGLQPDVELIRTRRQALHETDKQRRLDATRNFTGAKDHASALSKDRTIQESDLANARQLESDSQKGLKQLRSDGLSDEDRDRKRNTLAVEVLGLKEKYESVRQAMGRSVENPGPKLELWKAKRQKFEQDYSAADGELNRQLGILPTLLDQAPYGHQAQLEEELEALSTEIERDRLRSDSLKLLYDTLHDCETKATEGTLEPVTEKAAEFLMRICGQSFRPVLDTDLVFENVSTLKSDEPISLALLSGGEQQQAYLAVRLALADLLTRQAGRRELVVLDDVFANTDEERLPRVLEIINEMREHAQFLILTCHPDRYSALKDVKRISMEKIRG